MQKLMCKAVTMQLDKLKTQPKNKNNEISFLEKKEHRA